MTKIIETSIDSLIPDDKNFNRGTLYGEHLMDESVRKFGLGRSILLDKNNRIIAGNKTAEKAGELGYDKVVETCGEDAREREQFHVHLNKDTILNIHDPGKGAKSFSGRFPKRSV